MGAAIEPTAVDANGATGGAAPVAVVDHAGPGPGPDSPSKAGPPAPAAGPSPMPRAPVATRTTAGPVQPAPTALIRRLFEESYDFDFFQAVRLLQRLEPGRARVGRGGPPLNEAVRFRARISLSFPPSAIYELRKPTSSLPIPVMVQTFMGLTGPSGVLPRHYTEMLYKIERDVRTPEKHALRDWFDLFNHRLVSLFYRAWEKYRFFVPFERGEFSGDEPDPFTAALYSLVGLGFKSLRGRLQVAVRDGLDEYDRPRHLILARIEDLFLLHFGGMLGHRPKCAVALEAVLQDYFRVPARIDQFQGQWLPLERSSRTSLDGVAGNNQLGISAVAGDRIWDRQSKFRLRLGPMTYAQFTDFLPDREPIPERKTFFVLSHLVRLYAEPSLDFDVQLVLRAEDIPACRITGDGTLGARLGWNTWLLTGSATADAEDVILEGQDVHIL